MNEREKKEEIKSFILSTNVARYHICLGCKHKKNNECTKKSLPKLKYRKEKIFETCKLYISKHNE